MELIKEIGLQSVEIFILILGLVGMLISSLLLFSPKLIVKISNIFDRQIFSDKKLSFLNRTIHTDRIIYKYNIPIGLILITGTVFLLFFLFFQMDIAKVVRLFAIPKYNFLIEIITGVFVLAGKITAIAGLLLGFLLLFSPEAMIKIENRMDSWFATQFMVDKLDAFHHDVDEIILKYPLFFGFAGLMTSLILTLLALIALLT